MAKKQAKQNVQSSNTVFVALNRPNGIQFTMPDGRKVKINGNACDLRGKEKGVLPIGAFGLTELDSEDWDYIKKTYGRMELFENGLLFASDKKEKAKAEASEKEETRNGFEPVNTATGKTEPFTGEAA